MDDGQHRVTIFVGRQCQKLWRFTMIFHKKQQHFVCIKSTYCITRKIVFCKSTYMYYAIVENNVENPADRPIFCSFRVKFNKNCLLNMPYFVVISGENMTYYGAFNYISYIPIHPTIPPVPPT